MKNRSVYSNKQKLDSLFEHMKVISTLNNAQIESQWATYLCIRVSGLLETSIQSIYTSYCENKAHPNIIKYVLSVFKARRSQNMKPETLLNLAGAFNEHWRIELESYLLEEGRKDAIESIVNLRNNAAHGGTQSTTYSYAKDYYKKVWEVIVFIDNQCDR
jgi:hypothetical protein